MSPKFPLPLLVLGIALTGSLSHAAENSRQAHVILLIPADAEPPANHAKRLASIALRTEAFFAKWMAHWKYPIERSEIFARDEKGVIRVTVVKAKLLNTNGRQALPGARRAAIRGAMEQLKLADEAEPVWWILYDYPGMKGFQGGAMKFGGMAINAYPPGEEPIDQEIDIAAPEMAEMNIKGTIHEFGHALGLPHIGPKPNLKLGNSLMGPVNRAYWQKSGSDDTRVYLSEASAAALWKHPVFKKDDTPSPSMPEKVDVSDLAIEDAEDGKSFTVRGRLNSDIPAHAALVLDTAQRRFGDYWSRTYIDRMDAKGGGFEIVIDAPFERGSIFQFLLRNRHQHR